MSKLLIYDFECAGCGAKFEDMAPADVQYVQCHACDYVARRQISPVRIDRSHIALSASASPESIAHFDRVHRERKAIEEKSMREHGDYGKAAGSD
jgi:putative FmdB family regulatory protein